MPVPQVGARYVALGSSFAAGAGLEPRDPSDRDGLAGRSLLAYPALVASALRLNLVNAAVGGATIENLTVAPHAVHTPYGIKTLPPQLGAVDEDTALITLTIGGNDVGYVASVLAACALADLANDPSSRLGTEMRSFGATDAPDPGVVSSALARLKDDLVGAVGTIRSHAPSARIMLVDYLTLLPPDSEPCALMPVGGERREELRQVAHRLEEAIEQAATEAGTDHIAVSRASRDHHACASRPWVLGYTESWSLLHPNREGHAAVAKLIVDHLRRD